MGNVIRSLIFDLDGTLVDSRAGIVASLRQAVRAVFPDLETGHLDFQIGPPVREIMQAALGIRDELQLAALESAFRTAYDTHGWESVSLYPGVRETLEQFRRQGMRLFVVTNKPALPTVRILEKIELGDYFEAVLSRDSHQPVFRDKVVMLSHLLREYHIADDAAIYLGDSFEDLVAADKCRVRFIGIGYGYGSFPSTEHDLQVIDAFPSLAAMI